MKAQIYITLKNGVLDPQGNATRKALGNLGFEGVEDVRIGKFVEVEVSAANANDAEAQVKEMCEKLIANTVIENYRIEIIG